MPTIPLNDVKAQYAPLLEELKASFFGVLESGRFVLGPNVKAFEEEAARYLGFAPPWASRTAPTRSCSCSTRST